MQCQLAQTLGRLAHLHLTHLLACPVCDEVIGYVGDRFIRGVSQVTGVEAVVPQLIMQDLIRRKVVTSG